MRTVAILAIVVCGISVLANCQGLGGIGSRIPIVRDLPLRPILTGAADDLACGVQKNCAVGKKGYCKPAADGNGCSCECVENNFCVVDKNCRPANCPNADNRFVNLTHCSIAVNSNVASCVCGPPSCPQGGGTSDDPYCPRIIDCGNKHAVCLGRNCGCVECRNDIDCPFCPPWQYASCGTHCTCNDLAACDDTKECKQNCPDGQFNYCTRSSRTCGCQNIKSCAATADDCLRLCDDGTQHGYCYRNRNPGINATYMCSCDSVECISNNECTANLKCPEEAVPVCGDEHRRGGNICFCARTTCSEDDDCGRYPLCNEQDPRSDIHRVCRSGICTCP